MFETNQPNVYQAIVDNKINEQLSFEVMFECYFKREPNEREKDMFSLIMERVYQVDKESSEYYALLDEMFDYYIYNKKFSSEIIIIDDINACAKVAEVLGFTNSKYLESAALLKTELINMFNFLYPKDYLVGSFCEIRAEKETETSVIRVLKITDEHYELEV